MDPDEALRLLGNPTEYDFWRNDYSRHKREVGQGLREWLLRGGFKPKRWRDADERKAARKAP